MIIIGFEMHIARLLGNVFTGQVQKSNDLLFWFCPVVIALHALGKVLAAKVDVRYCQKVSHCGWGQGQGVVGAAEEDDAAGRVDQTWSGIKKVVCCCDLNMYDVKI